MELRDLRRMAEKLPIPRLLVTAPPAKKSKKRKTEEEKAATRKRLDKARAQTRVNIGTAFQQWRQLKMAKGFKSDEKVANYLLERYAKDLSTSTSVKNGSMRPPSKSPSDRLVSYELDVDVDAEDFNHNIPIDWDAVTWYSDKDSESVSSPESVSSLEEAVTLEEDETQEVDSEDED